MWRRSHLENGLCERPDVQLPTLTLSVDPQRYTCLQAGQPYRYESVDSDFVRELDVDAHGFVVTYQGLFRRVS